MDYKLIIFSGLDPLDPVDDNVDVEVQFQDGRRFGATLFTPRNIETLMRTWEETGECASGLYLWSTGMVVIRELTRASIEACVNDLIEEGQLSVAFEDYGPEDDLSGPDSEQD